ncbi:fungal specific transcription factor domain-containing protein [Aspergillus glaucus CBS 516.65]|uniref:Xylanolytic transcriptional activator regulatory domain-containing protein n=1 Tax=Aspergillus glaucus CBS 516.65 TaxID=1160497 RepID=A0A1L9VYW5_ASPGL|nr:hypothetical protein ASPGLDRAFT_21271 [Aspergillus glaucus CBS 516.65]OJJ89114.1 hypothetical protein ASPGLDRAFT_21271 [Aspergillus glaucus CBS 516.65]
MRLHENQQTQVDHGPRGADLESLISPRALADYLVDLYFSTFENTLRILHFPSFMTEYNAFWISRGERSGCKSCNDVFAAKLLALMTCTNCFADSEALASTETGSDSLQRNAQIWIRAVILWVTSATNYAQLNLGMIQVKCLLLIARQAISWEGDLTGMSSGFLMRETVMMGLHRDPVNFPNIAPFWAEIRRRLWLTIAELELHIALYSGVPVAISWDEFDCNPPSNVEDEDLLVESTNLPPSKPISVRTRTSFQITLAQTLQARLRIAKSTNSVRFSVSYDEVQQLSGTLTTALAEAPAELQANASADEHSGSPNQGLIFRRSLYLFLVYRCLLALHRPFFLSLAENHNEQYVVSRRLSFNVLPQLGGGADNEDTMTLDDACPRAARRCRDLLLADETNFATSGSGAGGDGDNMGLHVPTLTHLFLFENGRAQRMNTQPSQQAESLEQSSIPAFVEGAAGDSFEQLLSDWDMSLDPMSLYLIDSWPIPPDSFDEGLTEAVFHDKLVVYNI